MSDSINSHTAEDNMCIVPRTVRFGARLWAVLVGVSIFATSAIACDPGVLKSPITDKAKTSIRKGNGEWAAARAGDAQHGGVDLITNASYPDNASYAVHPIAPGMVVYSQLNGSETKGYGNVIVVDHGNNCYS